MAEVCQVFLQQHCEQRLVLDNQNAGDHSLRRLLQPGHRARQTTNEEKPYRI
jgi:hypothetical protein